jgi:hypothetical protein
MTRDELMMSDVVDRLRDELHMVQRDSLANMLQTAKEAANIIERQREALRVADQALWQLLDDMGSDGLCVCLDAKEQASLALAAIDAALKEDGE